MSIRYRHAILPATLLLRVVLFAVCWLIYSTLPTLTTQVYAAESDKTTLTLGIFPRRPATTTLRMFKPIAEALEHELRQNVRVVTAKNFVSFMAGVTAGRYDIVHFNQMHYLRSHDANIGYDVILMNEEFGSRTMAGAFGVRIDGGIDKVADMRGKKIIFGGGKTAMIAYLVNVKTLHEAGLKPGDYTALFAKNPPNAAIAVFRQQGHAAGIGNAGLRIPILKKEGVDPTQMKLVGISQQYPHLPWAVKSNLDAATRDKIRTAMLKLNASKEGKAVLQKAGMTGIHEADDSNYDVFRDLLDSLEKNGYFLPTDN